MTQRSTGNSEGGNKSRSDIPPENVLDLRQVIARREAEKFASQKKRSPWFPSTPNFSKPRLPHLPIKRIFGKAGSIGRKFAAGAKTIRPPKFHFTRFSLPSINRRAVYITVSSGLLVLAVAVVIIGMPLNTAELRGRVLGASTEAYDRLNVAQVSLTAADFSEASTAFTDAQAAFSRANDELRSLGVLSTLAPLIPGKGSEFRSGKYLLEAGERFSRTGARLTQILDRASRPQTGTAPNLIALLSGFQEGLHDVRPDLDAGLTALGKVNARDLPPNWQDRVVRLQAELPAARRQFSQVQTDLKLLVDLFGGATKRYLVLFENNDEMRPAGGFLGSIALLTFNDGELAAYEVPGGGSYDIAGQLQQKIIPPRPISLVNPTWNIQDSNWFPDFPTSAAKVVTFFESSGGFTPDGVIALTPDVVESILRITGPIDLQAKYGVTVDAESFRKITREQIEKAKLSPTPKQFLADLLPPIFSRLFQVEPKMLLRMTGALASGFSQKQLVIYSRDADVEARINGNSWGGQISPSAHDYLLVADANIGGGKTDGVIEELINHQSDVSADGSIIDTVTLIRSHHGSLADPFESERNVDYVRFYVPPGSDLLRAEGFETIPAFRFQQPPKGAIEDPLLNQIELNPFTVESSGTRETTEFGKTVFGNWLSVGPGETVKATISYRLPFRLNLHGIFKRSDRYEILIQKQIGSQDTSVVSQVSMPENLSIAYGAGSPGFGAGKRTAKISHALLSDVQYGVVIERK